MQGAAPFRSYYPGRHRGTGDTSAAQFRDGLLRPGCSGKDQAGVIDSLAESRDRLNLAEIRSVVHPSALRPRKHAKRRKLRPQWQPRTREGKTGNASEEPNSVASRTGFGSIFDRLKGIGKGLKTPLRTSRRRNITSHRSEILQAT